MVYNTLEEKQRGLQSLQKWGKNLFQILSRKKYILAFTTCVGFVPYIHCATILFKMYFKVRW